MENLTTDTFSLYVLIFMIIVFLPIPIVFFIRVREPIKKQRDYIKSKMKQAHGEEYKYWKRELMYSRYGHIPGLRRLFKRNFR